jgi:hypothetical protein
MIHYVTCHSELPWLVGKEWMTVIIDLEDDKKRVVYEWLEEETEQVVLILKVPRLASPGVSVKEPYTFEYMGKTEFIFESIEEALLFKLTWGGK